MTPSRDTPTEILGRINANIEHFEGSLPERVAIAWRGYLAAMLEWDLIPVGEYDVLTARLPPVPDDPAAAILLGWDAPAGPDAGQEPVATEVGMDASSASRR
jgi:hypothetical protein